MLGSRQFDFARTPMTLQDKENRQEVTPKKNTPTFIFILSLSFT